MVPDDGKIGDIPTMTEQESAGGRHWLRVPHTLVLMVIMMAAALVLTWILPAGSFQMQANEAGRMMVVPGTYEVVEDAETLSPWHLLSVVPRAMASASDVIFFVFLIGGVLGVVRSTGAIDAAIGGMLQHFRDRLALLVFASMFVFGTFSAAFGMAAEYIAFVGILVALCAALRLDAMTAVGMMVVGYGVGYGVSVMNPFTVMVAQDIAELQPLSGWWYRLAIAGPIFAIGFHHVYSYARKVQADPSKSLVAGLASAAAPPPQEYPPMNWARRLVLLALGATIVGLVLGVTLQGWWLTELAAVFLGLAVAAIIFGRLKLDDAAESFIAGAAQLTATALLVGFARSISLILEDGLVLHTIVNALATPLDQVRAEFSAVGMFLLQTLLNLFVPSGSGQAFATMPIMAPIGDLVGVSRQVTVLAFQFGDGFSNMIVPTNAVLMGILGLAGIPYDRWFRFVFPLMIKLTLAGSLALIIAVWIGYS
ncbi:MAG: Arginine/ornithine antiporter ArcD [Oceanicaulis sp. HLUCCA04]|nr:MAG: Arginine/ornithine antiporter ArcD [Oceanicaulis sp. HLUCCA04]